MEPPPPLQGKRIFWRRGKIWEGKEGVIAGIVGALLIRNISVGVQGGRRRFQHLNVIRRKLVISRWEAELVHWGGE